jgi:CheY-like chemotaxis protein
VHESAKTIESAAEKAAELTKQLLGFARKGKNQNVPVNLNKVIREVVGLLGRTIDKNIHISQHLCADGTIMGDPNQMQQVILNLAVNARDAMPKGGTLLIEMATTFLDEELCIMHEDVVPGQYIVVTVTDTGCGIHQEQLGRIMEPFFTTKEKGKGTGMGLAMVYGIVKNHGGAIHVSSEVGKGSIFKVFLPLVADKPDATVKGRMDEPIRGTGHILLVDDEDVVRKIASEMLRMLGYKVATAASGQEAVDYYREFSNEIDLIVLDMVMPEMNGQECFRELKIINPGVRAVLSTGYGLNGKAQEIIDEGMFGFITKPYHLREFSEAIKNALTVTVDEGVCAPRSSSQ